MHTHADVHALEALKSRRHPAVLANGEDNKERKTVVDCCLQGGCKTDVRGIKRPREEMRKEGSSECGRESAYNIALEEGAKRGRGGDGGGGGGGGGVSVKKVDEQRWDREGKKRRGRELCVLRSAHAFRERPRTQLVHLLLDVQPPARVPGFAVPTSPPVRCEKTFSTLTRRGSTHPRERRLENEIRNAEDEIAGLRSDDRSDRVHLESLIGSSSTRRP